MKKTTTIIICYFIFTLFFVSGVFNFTPTLTEVYTEDPDKAMFPDQLTEHKLQPVNTIKAVGNDSLVENVYFIVEVDVSFVKDKSECSIAYPEQLISVEQQGNTLMYRFSDELISCSDKLIEWKHGPDGNIKESDIQKDSTIEYSIQHLNGEKEIVKETCVGYQKKIRIKIKMLETPTLTVQQKPKHQLLLNVDALSKLTYQSSGDLGLADGSRIDTLQVVGYPNLSINNARIKLFTLNCKGLYNTDVANTVSISTDEQAQVNTLLISGKGEVQGLDESKFKHIVITPQRGKELAVNIDPIKQKLVIK